MGYEEDGFRLLSCCGRARCSGFCTYLPSEIIAHGIRVARARIACTGEENQHGTAASHLVAEALAATVNRRVASSSLARGATLFFQLARTPSAMFPPVHLRIAAKSCRRPY